MYQSSKAQRTASLSARRAWIEMWVDFYHRVRVVVSLSARRAWIEIIQSARSLSDATVALRKESVDRNVETLVPITRAL